MKKACLSTSLCLSAFRLHDSEVGSSFEERRTPQVTVSDGRIVVTPAIPFYFQDERDFDIRLSTAKRLDSPSLIRHRD